MVLRPLPLLAIGYSLLLVASLLISSFPTASSSSSSLHRNRTAFMSRTQLFRGGKYV